MQTTNYRIASSPQAARRGCDGLASETSGWRHEMYSMFSVHAILALVLGAWAVQPAFAQERAPGPFQHDGKLFKVPGNAAVWLIDRGKRRALTYDAWQKLFDCHKPEDIRDSDLKKLFPEGERVED